MLKKILFQVHWFVGITLGTLLAFSGLTGGLMAFGPELTDFFSGAYQKVAVQTNGPLSVNELYTKVRAAHPDKTITQLMIYVDPQRPARLQFAAPPGPRGPTGPRAETRFVDPYSGELLPARAFGQDIEGFMSWLRDVHQGHWAGPGTLSKIAATLIGLATVCLFLMALSGLYMRWPRGIAARRWQAWLKINPKLKGRPFLWNVHTVIGTCVLLAYLVSAHSGAFQNGEMSWYGNAVRSLVGLPPVREAGPPGAMAGGPPPMEAPDAGGPPMGEGGPGMSRGVRVFYMSGDSYINADAVVVNAKSAQLDPTTGNLTSVAEVTPRTFGEKLAANNQILHEGRLFGKVGVLIMMLAALCMPVFYITGWMMYLERRRRAHAVKAKQPIKTWQMEKP